MSNPLFQNESQPEQQPGGIMGLIFNKMYQGNPMFRDFVNNSKGKSIEDICRDHNIDPQRVKGMSENDIAQFLRNNGVL